MAERDAIADWSRWSAIDEYISQVESLMTALRQRELSVDQQVRLRRVVLPVSTRATPVDSHLCRGARCATRVPRPGNLCQFHRRKAWKN